MLDSKLRAEVAPGPAFIPADAVVQAISIAGDKIPIIMIKRARLVI